MLKRKSIPIEIPVALLLSIGVSAAAAPRGSDGQLRIKIADSASHEPIPARLHLKSSRRRPVQLHLPETIEFGDHFYVDGHVNLPLRAGQYTFELEATPEYRTNSGHFEIERHADDEKTIEVRRFANLAEEGWWGGDLDVSRRLADMPLAMRAEGLAVVPVTSSQFIDGKRMDAGEARGDGGTAKPIDTKAIYGPYAQRDQRLGGGLLLFNLDMPLNLSAAAGVSRSSLDVIREAKALDGIVIARSPLAWDLPVWLASGELDAITLIDAHSLREGVADEDKTDRPRDKSLYPGPTGRSRWGETVYYHVLNCGLRIPPAAGSGSGTNDSPLGTNRVYVYCGDDFSYERWWEGLVAGRVFITNGPLLRPLVEGQPPGYVFPLNGGQPAALQIGLDLATRVPIEYLQIVKNGEIVADARLDEFAKSGGRLPPVEFDDSGWFLVRAVTNDNRKHQFAASGPYYAEKNGQMRVSRRSVDFFLDWIGAAEQRLREERGLDEATRQKLLAEQNSAREFFKKLLAAANAE